MEIEILSQGNGITIARLRGRLDAGSASDVEQQMNAWVDRGNFKFILNFQQVDYLSSAGMRVLLALTKRLHHLGGSVVICHLSKEVTEVVRMAGFHQVLTFYTSEEESIAYLGAQ